MNHGQAISESLSGVAVVENRVGLEGSGSRDPPAAHETRVVSLFFPFWAVLVAAAKLQRSGRVSGTASKVSPLTPPPVDRPVELEQALCCDPSFPSFPLLGREGSSAAACGALPGQAIPVVLAPRCASALLLIGVACHSSRPAPGPQPLIHLNLLMPHSGRWLFRSPSPYPGDRYYSDGYVFAVTALFLFHYYRDFYGPREFSTRL